MATADGDKWTEPVAPAPAADDAFRHPRRVSPTPRHAPCLSDSDAAIRTVGGEFANLFYLADGDPDPSPGG